MTQFIATIVIALIVITAILVFPDDEFFHRH